jgi:hypothetical protein
VNLNARILSYSRRENATMFWLAEELVGHPLYGFASKAGVGYSPAAAQAATPSVRKVAGQV